MPGITGIIYKRPSPESAGATLSRMISTLTHEEFYSSGTLQVDGMRIAIGWVSHRGSFADCLPIWNETKDVCLVFNGEEFRDDCEVNALRSRGHQFGGDDASYLVHLYEEQGIDFLKRLNGWFSGVLIDRRNRTVTLFNDRFGLSRVYYHETDEAFYFSSEAKALLKVLPETREVNPQALSELLSCGCPLEGRALFRKISLIPSAAAWEFRAQKSKRGVYFAQTEWENQEPLNDKQYADQLISTFSRVVPRYLRGKARVGVSVTGGIDSRMIMAWGKLNPSSIPCYTFGGMYRDSRDVQLARQVASVCHQSHQVIAADKAMLADFPRLAERAVFISDGTMDVTGGIELYLNRRARTLAPVRVSGSYGGEILRGLVAFKPTVLDEALYPELSTSFSQVRETYLRQLCDRRLSFVAFKQVPWFHYARYSVEQSQVNIRSPFLDNEIVSLAYRAPNGFATPTDAHLTLRLIAEGSPALTKIETDRGLSGKSNGVGRIFRHYWQQATFKAEYFYDYGMPPWFVGANRLLAPLKLESQFLGRHKFAHFRVWYRDYLADYLRDVLLDRRTLERSFINPRRVEEIVRSHVSGSENHTLSIHRMLTCELLHRTLCDA